MLFDLSVAEMSSLLAARELSAVELVDAHIGRAEAVDGLIDSVVSLFYEDARREAQEADSRLKSGKGRGPLEGIPVGVKDIIDIRGYPTGCGSKLRQRQGAALSDAPVVAALRESGAVIFAKLNTHEYAMGGPSFDIAGPPTRNPWNRNYNPGGSSTGSAAAVAAGIVPLSIGTDTTGSIRHPAGACGVVGFKPTYGLVNAHGVFPLAWSLDHVGPISRTVLDAAIAMDALLGQGEVFSKSVQLGAALSTLDGARIGYVSHFHLQDLQADPEVIGALDRVAALLAADGADVRVAKLSSLQDFVMAADTIQAAEAWAIHAEALKTVPELYGRSSRQRLSVGAFLSAETLVASERQRHRLRAEVDSVLEEFDFLLTANMMEPACAIDDEEGLAFRDGRQARMGFNLTGHPAISLISGVSKKGLPLSLQLVGKRGGDQDLLAYAAAVERTASTKVAKPSTLL